jgi:hypothetical protein
MLTERYGEKEAARVLSRILGAAVDHGEELVATALQAALSRGRFDLLSLAEHLDDRRKQLRSVAVPEALSGYRVERTNASDYDRLLRGSGGGA